MIMDYIYIGVLFHFIGDYLLQNDWMASNKTKNSLAALCHAIIYSLPFLIILNFKFWLIVFLTHFFIDRYRLAIFWVKLINNNWSSNNYGFKDDKPKWLSTWLLIIIDNIWHIIINSMSIYIYLS